MMQVISVEDLQAERFLFDWPRGVNLEHKTILSFGGGGNLAETFQYAAAACGAIPVLSDVLPSDPARRTEVKAKLERIVGNLRAINQAAPAEWYEGDVTSLVDVAAILERVKKSFGRIDVVVNFAGMSHQPFDLYRDNPDDMVAIFRKVNDVNLSGAFIVTLSAARVMIPQRSGHIIHLCSSGSRCSLYGVYAYNATKHAVEGLIKTAAAQLAPFGVRVNGVAPGTVETDLNSALLREPDGRFKPRAKSILAHTPTKRFASREGVAETLTALCVDQRHLTGNVLFADDGYVIEGHSWPEGNDALYAGFPTLKALFDRLETDYPPETS
jgi:NAD(P)-dependent dehydrogenase (short-subunit alcohol dehydrogenase family)